jgi:hypothetical protein
VVIAHAWNGRAVDRARNAASGGRSTDSTVASTTRILRSLRRLHTQLPTQMPVSGLRVEALGDAIVVSQGDVQWQSHDGQYLLRFHVEAPAGKLAFLDAPAPVPVVTAAALLEQAIALEESRPDEARAVYRQAIDANPTAVAAYTNLGRLLHERRSLSKSKR